MDRRHNGDIHEEEKVEPAAETIESEEKLVPEEQIPSIEEVRETHTATEPAEEVPEPAEMPEPKAAPVIKKEILEEMDVGGFKISINIPRHIVEQAQSSSHEHRLRVAGALAAQILKKNPELTSSSPDDPISIWSDIREFIADRLK
jgi:hypothetical protein